MIAIRNSADLSDPSEKLPVLPVPRKMKSARTIWVIRMRRCRMYSSSAPAPALLVLASSKPTPLGTVTYCFSSTTSDSATSCTFDLSAAEIASSKRNTGSPVNVRCQPIPAMICRFLT